MASDNFYYGNSLLFISFDFANFFQHFLIFVFECYCIRNFLPGSPFHLEGKHVTTKCALKRGDRHVVMLRSSLGPEMVQREAS